MYHRNHLVSHVLQCARIEVCKIQQKHHTPCNCMGCGVQWMAHRPSLPAGIPLVPSALECFTTRFGMGRGGSTPLRARQWFRVDNHLRADQSRLGRPCPRSSIREALSHAHQSPPYVAILPALAALPVVSWGPYLTISVSILILGGISHLDAFSGSYVRT